MTWIEIVFTAALVFLTLAYVITTIKISGATKAQVAALERDRELSIAPILEISGEKTATTTGDDEVVLTVCNIGRGPALEGEIMMGVPRPDDEGKPDPIETDLFILIGDSNWQPGETYRLKTKELGNSATLLEFGMVHVAYANLDGDHAVDVFLFKHIIGDRIHTTWLARGEARAARRRHEFGPPSAELVEAVGDEIQTEIDEIQREMQRKIDEMQRNLDEMQRGIDASAEVRSAGGQARHDEMQRKVDKMQSDLDEDRDA